MLRHFMIFLAIILASSPTYAANKLTFSGTVPAYEGVWGMQYPPGFYIDGPGSIGYVADFTHPMEFSITFTVTWRELYLDEFNVIKSFDWTEYLGGFSSLGTSASNHYSGFFHTPIAYPVNGDTISITAVRGDVDNLASRTIDYVPSDYTITFYGSVPEPESWILLIFGFMILGIALRVKQGSAYGI